MSKKENSLKTALPQLRFPEFKNSKEWTRKNLNELLFETKKRNTKLEYDKTHVLSVSGEHGCVNQIEYMGRSYAGKSVKDYHIVEKGDIVYTKSPLKRNPYGVIKENKEKSGIVSTLYAVYRTKDACNPEFLDYYFSRDYNLNTYLEPIIKKGPKNDMKVNNFDVLSGGIWIPEKKEQIKISNFLFIINELIKLETEKLHALKKHKTGLMQVLFPVEGKNIPTLRFPEFYNASAWEIVPLGGIAKRITLKNKNAAIGRVLTNSASDGVVDQRDYFDKDIANTINLEGYYIFEKGDYVYNPRISTLAPVGPISKNKVGTGVISPLYTVFRFEEKNNDFYEQYFKSTHWHYYMRSISNTGARHDRMSVTSEQFMRIPLPHPSPNEQEKIANCFASVDSMITAQYEKIGAIKMHKNGLLQQLFPTYTEFTE